MNELLARKLNDEPGYSVAGDLYRFLALSADTGGTFSMFHATIAPGGGPPPHIHERESEAFYVLKGELTFYAVDTGEVSRGGPGFFIYLPSNRPHRFANESGELAEALILATPAGLEQMFFEAGTKSERALPVTPEEIARLMVAAPKYGVTILPPE